MLLVFNDPVEHRLHAQGADAVLVNGDGRCHRLGRLFHAYTAYPQSREVPCGHDVIPTPCHLREIVGDEGPGTRMSDFDVQGECPRRLTTRHLLGAER